MKIDIKNDAASWYKAELELKDGDHLRFFVRYGGFSSIQKGFSLGVSKEEPDHIAVKTIIDGVTYYIEEKDLWYFDDHDLIVEFNSIGQEPELKYEKR